MGEFFKSRLGLYLTYTAMVLSMKIIFGFETTVLFMCAYILGDIDYNNKHKNDRDN